MHNYMQVTLNQLLNITHHLYTVTKTRSNKVYPLFL